MIKGIEKSLVIWSFWMPFKRIRETIFHISSLCIQSEFTKVRFQCRTNQLSWGGYSNPNYSVPPNSWGEVDSLTQAAVSHPTVELRGDSITQASVSHPIVQPRGMLTQATVSHPTVQPRGTLWPRLQCPPYNWAKGEHSNPGYIVPPS